MTTLKDRADEDRYFANLARVQVDASKDPGVAEFARIVTTLGEFVDRAGAWLSKNPVTADTRTNRKMLRAFPDSDPWKALSAAYYVTNAAYCEITGDMIGNAFPDCFWRPGTPRVAA